MYNKLHPTLKVPSMNNCEILILYTVHMDFGSENIKFVIVSNSVK